MTAKRTSRGKAASVDAPEAGLVPSAEREEAPPPMEAAEAPDEVDLSAHDPDAPDTDGSNPDAAEELSAAEAEPLEDLDASEGSDALEAAGEDDLGADAPPVEGSAPGDPLLLHRRARHDETEELLAWLRAAPAEAPLTLDASEVDNVSTPYVLAIVAAARARADAGSPAVVTSPSPAFVDAFSDLGLFGDLMKMEIRA